VRSKQLIRRGNIETEWNRESQQLTTEYSNKDFRRTHIVRLECSSAKAVYGNGRIGFEVDLPPGARWHCCCKHDLVEPERHRRALSECAGASDRFESSKILSHWEQVTTQITTSNEDVYRLYRQSVDDLAALRLPMSGGNGQEELLAAAGVPWFVTVFGRDSLIVSLQSMIVYPDFARGTLHSLADLQATQTDDYRDADPGKIPHELRYGELAYFKQVPHTPYYGTADATSLYIIALHEAWKWLGDGMRLPRNGGVALKWLEWMDRYRGLYGAGFQEGQTPTARGY